MDKFKVNSPFWRLFIVDMWSILRQHNNSIMQKQKNLVKQRRRKDNKRLKHFIAYRNVSTPFLNHKSINLISGTDSAKKNLLKICIFKRILNKFFANVTSIKHTQRVGKKMQKQKINKLK